ncbi:MAG: addiction module protein [Pirellulaceae bacterium]|nr:addiction module protein [Pirellulaceae bacterium]
MTLKTMIGTLSRDEKLAAMDLIWRDLTADSQAFISPTWHEKVISERLDHPVPGPTLPLAEAKAEIKEAIDVVAILDCRRDPDMIALRLRKTNA